MYKLPVSVARNENPLDYASYVGFQDNKPVASTVKLAPRYPLGNVRFRTWLGAVPVMVAAAASPEETVPMVSVLAGPVGPVAPVYP